MPTPPTVRQHRVFALSTLFLALALVMPAAVVAQDDSTDVAAPEEDIARQIKGTSRQKRVAGPKASCRAFNNGATFKRGKGPGKGQVKRDFGPGNGDKGDLIFTDAPTGTALFWTDDAGYLSVHVAALIGDVDEVELTGLLFEAAPDSMAREALTDRLIDRAATVGVTPEQMIEVLDGMARELDGGCIWSTRFVPRKGDRDRVVPFWEAMTGARGDPSPPDDGRFEVEAAWRDLAGDAQSVGRSVDAVSSDDGAPGDLFDVGGSELVVQLVDACSSNDHFWVFAAGATGVEFELTVTDTTSGQTKTYSNPLSEVPAVTDTTAFATCP